MAPHSSTLAWKIPWTEKPGRLQSMGLQRVRHDWVTSLFLTNTLFLDKKLFSVHYGKYLREQTLDHTRNPYIMLYEIAQLSSEVIVLFCITTKNQWLRFKSLLVFNTIRIFCHFNKCRVIYLCAFNIYFLNEKFYGAQLCVLLICISSLVKVQILCAFLIELFFFFLPLKDTLYIL